MVSSGAKLVVERCNVENKNKLKKREAFVDSGDQITVSTQLIEANICMRDKRSIFNLMKEGLQCYMLYCCHSTTFW